MIGSDQHKAEDILLEELETAMRYRSVDEQTINKQNRVLAGGLCFTLVCAGILAGLFLGGII
jgi:hypothetical protein